jgi:hypothetical protein
VIPPVAIDGPLLTVRKFSKSNYTIDQLIEFDTLTRMMADFLRACIKGRLNIIISGGTGSGKTTKEIAEKVNVRYVLEGSVRKAGNNLRITAQLIDAVTDTHLWAEKYSGTLDDVFDIQEKVSRSIADELKVQLSPEENQKIAFHRINDIQVYEYYLKAIELILKEMQSA